MFSFFFLFRSLLFGFPFFFFSTSSRFSTKLYAKQRSYLPIPTNPPSNHPLLQNQKENEYNDIQDGSIDVSSTKQLYDFIMNYRTQAFYKKHHFQKPYVVIEMTNPPQTIELHSIEDLISYFEEKKRISTLSIENKKEISMTEPPMTEPPITETKTDPSIKRKQENDNGFSDAAMIQLKHYKSNEPT